VQSEGAEVQRCRVRCRRGAEGRGRCRGAELQSCRAAELQLQRFRTGSEVQVQVQRIYGSEQVQRCIGAY